MTTLNHEQIGNRWVLLRQGREVLIVQPYLIEDTGDGGVEVEYVYGHGGSRTKGDSYSLHDRLEDAIREAGVTVSARAHSDGEVMLATDRAQT